MPDGHQEAVLPIAVLAALVAVALGLTVALRTGRARNALSGVDCRNRIAVAIATLAATFVAHHADGSLRNAIRRASRRSIRDRSSSNIGRAIDSAMSSFDHCRPVVSIVLGVAAAAGKLAACAIVRFLRVDRSARAGAMPRADDSFGTRILHRALVLELGALVIASPSASPIAPTHSNC